MLNRTDPARQSLSQRGLAASDTSATDDESTKAFAKRAAPGGTEPAGVAGTGVAEIPTDDAPAIAMGPAPDRVLEEKYGEFAGGRKRGGKGGRGGAAAIRTEERASSARDTLGRSAATTLTDNWSPSARPDGAHVAEGTPVAAGYPTFGALPAYNLIVAPRNENEYHASLENVARWQRASPVIAGQTFGEEPAGGVYRAGRVVRGTPVTARKDALVTARQDFTVDIPAEQFKEVLDSFELQAPRQVQIVMNFPARDLEQVRQMVDPSGAPVAEEATERFAGANRAPARGLGDAEEGGTPGAAAARAPTEPETEETRRFAAGSRGRRARVVAPPAEPAARAPMARERIGQADRVLAHRRKETLDGEAMRQLRSLGYLGDSVETQAEVESGVEAEVEEALAEPVVRAPSFKLQTPADPRRPRVEEVAARVPVDSKTPQMRNCRGVEEAAPGEKKGLAAPPPSVGLALREQVETVQARLGEMYEIMVGGAFHATEEQRTGEVERAPAGSTVTVQITLLPPSSSAELPPASQPATQPGE
jgi:hypothetical protein